MTRSSVSSWPDLSQEAARTQLRKALSALREILGPDAVGDRGEGEIRLNQDHVWCDAVALRQHVRSGHWAEAVALYRGELLDGLYPEGVAQSFEEWLADTRRSLRNKPRSPLGECSRTEEERGDPRAAAVLARRALELAPDDEDGVRRLMSLLDRHGDRGGALRVYGDWQARLQQEYGVEPAPETRKLARKVPSRPQRRIPRDTARPASLQPWVREATVEVGSCSAKAASPGLAGAPQLLGVTLIAIVALVRDAASDLTGVRQSIAVLPMRSIGGPDVATASQAIEEELITALALEPGLAVHSPVRLQETGEEAGEAERRGKLPNVAYLVDGGVQLGSGRLRLTVRLVRTSNSTAVWAGFYDAQNEDVASFSRQAAAQAVAAIRAYLATKSARED